MKLVSATPEAARYVVDRLREADRREVDAVRWRPSEDGVWRELVADTKGCWTASTDDGEPVTIIGARPLWPGVWSAFSLSTDAFRQIATPLTKWVRRSMIPSLAQAGAHRIQCHVLASHAEARAWLNLLGVPFEALLRQFGRNGEDFAVHAWLRQPAPKTE